MELGMGFFQVGDAEAEVALRSRQRAMPQQILDVPQVGLVLHQVGRAGVAPHMGSTQCEKPYPKAQGNGCLNERPYWARAD
jgi:hypothetical protein